jgi:transposase
VVGREVHVHYGEGMASSKLKLPFAAKGTGRNLSTVRKMLAMARETPALATPTPAKKAPAKKPAAKRKSPRSSEK